MKKGYWIARVEVADLDMYMEYAALASESVASHGGTYLVRGGDFEPVEGDARSRNVVIEFPSYRAAIDCYNSKQYAEARALRQEAAESDFLVIEGHEAE